MSNHVTEAVENAKALLAKVNRNRRHEALTGKRPPTADIDQLIADNALQIARSLLDEQQRRDAVRKKQDV